VSTSAPDPGVLHKVHSAQLTRQAGDLVRLRPCPSSSVTNHRLKRCTAYRSAGAMGNDLGAMLSRVFSRPRTASAPGTTKALRMQGFRDAPKRTRTSTRLSRTRPSTWRHECHIRPMRPDRPMRPAIWTDRTHWTGWMLSRMLSRIGRRPTRLDAQEAHASRVTARPQALTCLILRLRAYSMTSSASSVVSSCFRIGARCGRRSWAAAAPTARVTSCTTALA